MGNVSLKQRYLSYAYVSVRPSSIIVDGSLGTATLARDDVSADYLVFLTRFRTDGPV